MIYLAMPVSSSHGWGICGKYLTREINNIHPGQLRLILPPGHAPLTPDTVGDDLECFAAAPLQLTQSELPQHLESIPTPPGTRFKGPLLTCINDKSFAPLFNVRGTRTVGYTFFEDNILAPEWIENARRHYDTLTTGSSWNTRILKDHGLADVHTVIQGVDSRLFFPMESPDPREFLRDRFVIFSGGKFELRKGQDIVIRAVKVMQDRHPDVFLINAWFNLWQSSFDTMKASPYLQWPNATGAYLDVMKHLLAHNGLDIRRIITLGPRANPLMARIYRNSDVGLFPNRAEGGTNLVLMEYMACGRAAIATASTGHADVVHSEYAIPISSPTVSTYNTAQGPMAQWPEPNLDETVEKVEWAYQHRAEIKTLGQKAAAAMATLTWEKAARSFLELLDA